jgi:hypothetical protein
MMKTNHQPDVTELLRSLPDMQPPAGSWEKLHARHRRHVPWVWSSAALAACAALVAVVLLTRPEPPVETFLVQAERDVPIPANVRVADEASDLRALRQRSQQLERLLQGLPPRSRIVRVDTAAPITDLQDQLAAVDYELNRIALLQATAGQSAADRDGGARAQGATQPPRELWRQRNALMDRLVHARFVEAGASAF